MSFMKGWLLELGSGDGPSGLWGEQQGSRVLWCESRRQMTFERQPQNGILTEERALVFCERRLTHFVCFFFAFYTSRTRQRHQESWWWIKRSPLCPHPRRTLILILVSLVIWKRLSLSLSLWISSVLVYRHIHSLYNKQLLVIHRWNFQGHWPLKNPIISRIINNDFNLNHYPFFWRVASSQVRRAKPLLAGCWKQEKHRLPAQTKTMWMLSHPQLKPTWYLILTTLFVESINQI